MIDSGVHASHPHVGGVAGGVGIDEHGATHDDYVDRLGHGTAVAAAIREKAPDADIFAIKVFDRELAATGAALVAACEYALTLPAQIVNLSLGTQNPDHEAGARPTSSKRLRDARRDRDRRGRAGRRSLAARIDCRRVGGDARLVRAARHAAGSIDWIANGACVPRLGFPRPIPGVPPERNLKGLSFAVANVTGIVAKLLADDRDGRCRRGRHASVRARALRLDLRSLCLICRWRSVA